MAIPSWPGDVPYASTYGGFSVEQVGNPVLRTEMNSGTGRQRRVSTGPKITQQKLTIEMTPAQEASFDAFHASIGEGAARFTMPVWNGSAYVPRSVSIDQGKVSKTQLGPDTKSVSFMVRIETLD